LCAALVINAPLQALAADPPRNLKDWQAFKTIDRWYHTVTKFMQYDDFFAIELRDGAPLYAVKSKAGKAYTLEESGWTLKVDKGRFWDSYYAVNGSEEKSLYRPSFTWGSETAEIYQPAPIQEPRREVRRETPRGDTGTVDRSTRTVDRGRVDRSTGTTTVDRSTTTIGGGTDVDRSTGTTTVDRSTGTTTVDRSTSTTTVGRSTGPIGGYPLDVLNSMCPGVLAEVDGGARTVTGQSNSTQQELERRAEENGSRSSRIDSGAGISSSVDIAGAKPISYPPELVEACKLWRTQRIAAEQEAARRQEERRRSAQHNPDRGTVPNLTAENITPDKNDEGDPAADAKKKRLMKRAALGGAIGAVGFGILGMIFMGPFGLLAGAIAGGVLMAGVTHLNNTGIK